ncbi:hypothetical protein QBC37DRAFT_379403 [Rhypophila decipiens]|uniref:Uncharacterized protein n=1 Tax=Rhypophila decipiens TaxID=261697 RepID=A0AAN6XYN7_9PEZI|nr:hypothetical protein QBC37DRAFT_379403 [Rhypophila decipiens]
MGNTIFKIILGAVTVVAVPLSIEERSLSNLPAPLNGTGIILRESSGFLAPSQLPFPRTAPFRPVLFRNRERPKGIGGNVTREMKDETNKIAGIPATGFVFSVLMAVLGIATLVATIWKCLYKKPKETRALHEIEMAQIPNAPRLGPMTAPSQQLDLAGLTSHDRVVAEESDNMNEDPHNKNASRIEDRQPSQSLHPVNGSAIDKIVVLPQPDGVEDAICPTNATAIKSDETVLNNGDHHKVAGAQSVDLMANWMKWGKVKTQKPVKLGSIAGPVHAHVGEVMSGEEFASVEKLPVHENNGNTEKQRNTCLGVSVANGLSSPSLGHEWAVLRGGLGMPVDVDMDDGVE